MVVETEERRLEVQGMIARYKEEYNLSQRNLAKYLGVNQYVVYLWNIGRFAPNDENFDKLREIPLLLAGRSVKYRGQALDILMGRD